jgi:phosphoribosylformimino-5-aminoimidazole carboxamide ribotide isomerase
VIAIPAIDLQAGQPGRSAAGTAPRRSSDVARALSDVGFRRLHILESGVSSSVPEVEEILRDTDARVQVGGVSSASEIEQLLRAGVEHVVVGARGLDEPEWLADMADLYPGEIGVVTDVRDRRVVRRGWVRTLPVDLLDVVDELNVLPLRELLVSTRAADGAMSMADLALLEDVVERARFPVSVRGGVATVSDLRALEHRGVGATIIEADRLLAGELDGRRVAQEFTA